MEDPMRLSAVGEPRWGITVIRLMMGLILVVAGTQKWLAGIGGFINFVTQLGIPFPQVVGPVIATGELIGGLLLLVGFGTRWVALWFICEFLVTALYVKLGRGAGWDAARIDLMLLAGAGTLAVGGAGALALDEWLIRRKPSLSAQQVPATR
jgi:putative oxidoreductase